VAGTGSPFGGSAGFFHRAGFFPSILCLPGHLRPSPPLPPGASGGVLGGLLSPPLPVGPAVSSKRYCRETGPLCPAFPAAPAAGGARAFFSPRRYQRYFPLSPPI